ncbi:uncharacterized protein LOC8268271 [Ricinus communis]|nr:uncharacterized protein LOC8268271 [Ricinus communis]|eukprot:XP_002532317.2 uncharacterized protein LOC8268271 [Ricinus communis]
MMKKVFAILLLFIVYSATAADDAAPAPPSDGGSPNKPSFPLFPRRSFPWIGHGRAFPPLPAGFPHPKLPPTDSNSQKCLQDFHVEQGCVNQILHSYASHNINLDASCCSVVDAIKQDCVSPIFAHFSNPFFGGLLKQHCSSPPTPSTPSAPAPATPSA